MTRQLRTCREAERAISHDLDELLDDLGRWTLHAHLRACDPCGRLAHNQRGQQGALRALADIALPSTLRSFDPDTRV